MIKVGQGDLVMIQKIGWVKCIFDNEEDVVMVEFVSLIGVYV